MANDNWQLKAILSAVDRMSPVLKQIAKQAQNTRKYLGDVASSATNLAGQVGVPLGLISGALAALSVAGVQRAVVGFAQLGDEVVKSAQRIGISTDDYQRIAYVAGQSGVAADELGSSMGRLNKSIAQAEAGKNKDLSSLFAKAGISMRDANGQLRSGVDLLPQVADLFARNGNAATQARMGNAIFGKSWQALAPLLQGGSDGINELTQRYKELGLGMANADLKAGEAFGDKLDDLRASTGMYANVIGAKLLPTLSPLIEKTIGWAVANRELITGKISKFVLDLAASLERVDWAAMVDGMRSTIASARQFIDWIGGAGNALIALVLIVNAQTIVALVSLVGALGRAGFAFLAMAGRAYLAANISLMSMGRIALVALATAGPIGAIGAAFTWMGALAAGSGGIVAGAMALVRGAIHGVNAALLANPLGVVLALATAAYLVYENWDTLKTWFTGFFDWISAKFQAVVGWAVDLAKATAGLFSGNAEAAPGTTAAQAKPVAMPKYAQDAAKALAPAAAPGSSAAPAKPMAMPPYAQDAAKALAPSATAAPAPGALPVNPRTLLVTQQAPAAKVDGSIKIDFTNLPQGARVEQSKGSSLPIKLNVGYSSAALGGAF